MTHNADAAAGTTAPRFLIAGSSTVTGRALTSADDGTYNLTVLAEENGATVSNTLQVVVASTTTCPQGSGYPLDGCAVNAGAGITGAPVCVSSTTCYQQTNFFTTYTSSI